MIKNLLPLVKELGMDGNSALDEKQVVCDWEILGVMILLDKVSKKARVSLLRHFAWM